MLFGVAVCAVRSWKILDSPYPLNLKLDANDSKVQENRFIIIINNKRLLAVRWAIYPTRFFGDCGLTHVVELGVLPEITLRDLIQLKYNFSLVNFVG